MISERNSTEDSNFEMLFEYVEKRNADEECFKSSVIEHYKKFNTLKHSLFQQVALFTSKCFEPEVGQTKYFFFGIKLKEIILGLPRENVCVIVGPGSMLFCLRNNFKFLANEKVGMWLSKALLSSNFTDYQKKILSLIDTTSDKLRAKASNDAVLILDNDSLPMQRAMILAARMAGMKCVCIQHGIFQSKSPSHFFDGWFSDQFLVFSEQQKTMLVQKGMSEDKIKVMGFHSSHYIPQRVTAQPGNRKVCFLGQPWQRYSEHKGKRYLDIVQRISRQSFEAGISLAFKPHPGELGADYLNKFDNVAYHSLSEAIEEYDVFISLTSTALFEAEAAGRVAIQIIDDVFDTDDFSISTQIYSFSTRDELWVSKALEAINFTAPKQICSLPPATRLLKTLDLVD